MAFQGPNIDTQQILAFTYIAIDELSEAHQYANALLKSGLLQEHSEDCSPAHRALDLALIVSYARPFTKCRGYGHVKPARDKALTSLSPDELELHKRIMSARDKEYAHSDADANDIIVFTDGIFQYGKRLIRSPLTATQVNQLSTMINKLMKSFNTQSEEFRACLIQAQRAQ